jgi:dienelactone hydrolase
MILERTCYYAKPGQAEEVLRTRRKASDVRARLGLPRGTIVVKVDPAGDGPDVAWECAFPTAEAHARDLSARAASPEFEAVRAVMTTLLARFERQVARRDGGPGAPSADGPALVPREQRFTSGGRELVGYLFTPPGPGPFPCVVTNHGSTIHQGTTDVCRPGTAALLSSWGYASFLPHRRGYGSSPGPAWRSEVTAEFGTEEYDGQLARRLTAESEDVVAALELVGTLPEIAPGRLAVLGSSFGGTVSLLAGARGGGAGCVVDFAGAAMNWERTPALRETMRAAVRALQVPIFLIQAENDYSTAPTRELAAELARLGKPHQARVYPPFGLTADEGHVFARDGALVWGDEVRAFLDRWVAGA